MIGYPSSKPVSDNTMKSIKKFEKKLSKINDIDLLRNIIHLLVLDINCSNCKIDCKSNTLCEFEILNYYIKKSKEK